MIYHLKAEKPWLCGVVKGVSKRSLVRVIDSRWSIVKKALVNYSSKWKTLHVGMLPLSDNSSRTPTHPTQISSSNLCGWSTCGAFDEADYRAMLGAVLTSWKLVDFTALGFVHYMLALYFFLSLPKI